MKIGLVGLGYWGKNILRNLASIKNIDIIICDKDEQLLETYGKKYGATRIIEGYNNFSDMLQNKLDAVIIATNPLATHYNLAKKALEAGVNVWLEKPMTATKKEAGELVRLAEKKGLILHVDHTFVYSGPVKQIKRIIDKGELGNITNVHIRWLNLGLYQEDMDVIWDLCPHAFSMLNYWFEMTPEEIHKAFPYGDDDAHITLDYDSLKGIFQAHIHVSWNYPEKVRECVIVGTKKMLIYDDLKEDKIVVYNKRVEFSEDEEKPRYVDDGKVVIVFDENEPLLDECKHFIECVKKGEQTQSSGRDGAFVIEMLEKTDLR